MALVSALWEILQRPTISGVMGELMMLMAPLWIAVIVGVLVGWAWRPKWANLGRELLVSSVAAATTTTTESSPSQDATTTTTTTTSSSSSEDKESQSLIDFGLIPSFNSLKLQLPSCISWISDDGLAQDASLTECSPQLDGENSGGGGLVVGDDLEHLCQLVEVKDGGPSWIQMMDRSTPTMYYQAWRRDPESPLG